MITSNERRLRLTAKLACVILASAAFGLVPIAEAEEPVELFPTVDSLVYVNFDEADVRGFKTGLMPNGVNLTVAARLAPTGREDPWRPAPGLIEEYRTAIEFDLTETIAANPGGIGSATLILTFHQPMPDPYGASNDVPFLRILVYSYSSDGQIAGLSESDGLTWLFPASLPADFNPPDLVFLRSIVISNSTPEDTEFVIHASSAINEAIGNSQTGVGFLLVIDPETLPARESLSTDTSWGVRFYSANDPAALGPQLVLHRYPTGEARDLVQTLLAGAGLPDGVATSLLAKLDQADAALTRDKPNVVRHKLTAFIKRVRALVKAGMLTPADGQVLIDAAEDAIDILGGWG